MSYASASDFLLWYGAREVVAIATPDDFSVITADLMRSTVEQGNRSSFTPLQRASADAALARLQAALNDASRQMDTSIARRYPLPLSDQVIQAGPLPRICGTLARYLLMDDQADAEVSKRYELAIRWLEDLANGLAILGNGPVGPGLPRYAAGQRLFDDNALRGF